MPLTDLLDELAALGHNDLVYAAAKDKVEKKDSKFLKSADKEDVLTNSNCKIEYDKVGKQISGIDLTDPNNDPAFYTKSRRGLEKAWNDAIDMFDEETSMNDVTDILDKYNIRYHSWCMMD